MGVFISDHVKGSNKSKSRMGTVKSRANQVNPDPDEAWRRRMDGASGVLGPPRLLETRGIMSRPLGGREQDGFSSLVDDPSITPPRVVDHDRARQYEVRTLPRVVSPSHIGAMRIHRQPRRWQAPPVIRVSSL